MPLPPNADTIAYPAHNPTVILSVSEDALDFEAGLDAPLDLYVERFQLKKTLSTKNTNAKDPTQYGLYTNTISVAQESPRPVSTRSRLEWRDGGYFKQTDQKDETLVKNGFDGGIMNLYVQDIDHEIVQSIFLNVSGGKGFTPEDVIHAEKGETGGNGGKGGNVSVLFGTAAVTAHQMVAKLLEDLHDKGDAFPFSFQSPTSDLAVFCRRQNLPNISSSLEALNRALVNKQKCTYQGGYGGGGSRGSIEDGKNGVHGTKGKEVVHSLIQPELLWQSPICFAHPIQCRMLLDKAKLYFYIDGDKNLAQCKLLLQRLLGRLNFLNTSPPLTLTGKDFYGFDRRRVPRRTYMAVSQSSTDAAKRKDYVSKSATACQIGKATKKILIKEAKDHLQDCVFQIQSLTGPIKKAYGEIEGLTRDVKVEIRKDTIVPFDHLLEAVGQIVSVYRDPMELLKGTSLLQNDLPKIPDDSGVKVEKEYLVKQIDNITGSLDSLYEGYKVSKSGSIDLLDPGAAKLQLASGELAKLVGQYENALPSDLLKKLKKKLDDLSRNDAVIRYNTSVALIIQCYTEIAALSESEKTLAGLERSTLATDSPVMTVAMKRTYMVLVQQLQSWLYKAQRAYNFDGLNSSNILAEFFGTIDTSRYTHALVSQAHNALYHAYSEYLDDQTKARTIFNTARYQLDASTCGSIQKGGQQGELLFIQIDPSNQLSADDGPSPFRGMSDVRLTRVRCFLPGAKTADGLLHITLTHMGDEALVDPRKKQMEFSHSTIPVDFKYQLRSGRYDVAGTRDGIIGKLKDREQYSLVGPFTTWQIVINKEYNPGLDLSGVFDAYMEFEGAYRPLT
ncbi:hypothetical protein PDIDSM_1135 [Penicillium digitatum]|nr:hypothetical protein PDIDSM_1135 [Penicillium digitatum]